MGPNRARITNIATFPTLNGTAIGKDTTDKLASKPIVMQYSKNNNLCFFIDLLWFLITASISILR